VYNATLTSGTSTFVIEDMKKYFVIPLLIIYLISISGLTIHAHYCGSHLMSWSIGAKGEGCGVCEKSSKCKKCCKDKDISYKVSNEQNTIAALKIKKVISHFPIADQLPVFDYSSTQYRSYYFHSYAPNASPGQWQFIPLYKLHSSFTYYG